MHEHRRKVVPQIIHTRPKSPGLGHLALKSSVFAPTAMSFIGQDYVFNHMKSHYRRISSAKAAVDTTPPRAMTSNIKAQDRKRRNVLAKNSPASSPRPGTGRLSQRSTYSAQGEKFTSNDVDEYECFARTSTPNKLESNTALYAQQSSRSRQPQARNTLRYSDGKQHISYDRSIKDESIDSSRENYNTYLMEESPSTYNRLNEDKPDTRLDLFGLRSKSSRQIPQPAKKDISRKDPHLVIWENDQKYLKFTQEVTADVLARGIFSDRVLNKVFESHIDKNREELDEERMREMIEELKIDLGMGNHS